MQVLALDTRFEAIKKPAIAGFLFTFLPKGQKGGYFLPLSIARLMQIAAPPQVIPRPIIIIIIALVVILNLCVNGFLRLANHVNDNTYYR